MKYTSRHALKPTVFNFTGRPRSRGLSLLMTSTLAGGLALTLSCGGGGGESSAIPNQAPPSTPALVEVVVSPDGDAGSLGSPSAPTTLEGAQAIIRNTARTGPGALRVLLRGGLYVRSATFALGAADSGTAENPVEYVAYPGDTPRITGGPSLAPTIFQLVDANDPNYARLDTSARSKIFVADLSNSTLDLGSLASRTPDSSDTTNRWLNKAMEVFTDGEPLALARYPKAVDPETVNLAPTDDNIEVTGDANFPIALTGIYEYKGLDSVGRPYYQRDALYDGRNQRWTICGSSISPYWQLNNRSDLPGCSGNGAWTLWGNEKCFSGPVGRFDAVSVTAGKPTGTAYLAPTKAGSLPLPGFWLIKDIIGPNTIKAPESTHLNRWTHPEEAMWYGFGYVVWDACHSQIASVDKAAGSLTFVKAPPDPVPPQGLRAGQPFFVYNLLEELTDPGEYFVDRTYKRLYLRPIADKLPGEIVVSQVQAPLVTMSGVKYVTWQGVVFEAGRANLADVRNCENVTFNDCQFRNAGGWGLLLSGYRNLVQACEFKQLGKGAIQVWGGDRFQLTPGNTVIQNCNIHDYGRIFPTNYPAINVFDYEHGKYQDNCIGITVRHNEIQHGPYIAIVFQGNGHTIRYNHIHHVCQWINDSGAIYSMRDWGSRANAIQYNLMRNNGGPLGNQIYGVYLDMGASGITVEGNIFYKAGPNMALVHSGGRDVTMQYNIFYGHWYGTFTSNSGIIYISQGGSGDLLDKLVHFNYQSPPWSTAYPEVAVIPNDWAQIRESHWLQPEGSVFYGNLQWGGNLPPALSSSSIREGNYDPSPQNSPLHWFTQNAENINGGKDPEFVNPGGSNPGDYMLQPTSPMYGIPGFPGIDASKIGIQN